MLSRLMSALILDLPLLLFLLRGYTGNGDRFPRPIEQPGLIFEHRGRDAIIGHRAILLATGLLVAGTVGVVHFEEERGARDQREHVLLGEDAVPAEHRPTIDRFERG